MASEIADWIAAVTDQEKELSETLKKVEHYYVQCGSKEDKYAAVADIVKHGYGPAITFCKTNETAKWVADKLTDNGLSSLLHQENTDIESGSVNCKFRDNAKIMLITTDRLAKEVDLNNVSTVVNYDPPTDMDNEADCGKYLCRIERAGKMGKVISLVHGFTSMEIVNSIRDKFRITLPQLKTEDIKQLFQSERSTVSQ